MYLQSTFNIGSKLSTLYYMMEHSNLKAFPKLTIERLTLRQLSVSDVQEIFQLRSNPLINKYLNRQLCKTLDEALQFIEKIKNNTLTYWAITEKGNQTLVGTICLFDISEELKTGEIGYELLAQHQGKGIMKEAAKRIIKYSNEALGLKTINAYAHKDNISSINLLQKLKFSRTDNLDERDSDLMLFRLTLIVKEVNQLSKAF